VVFTRGPTAKPSPWTCDPAQNRVGQSDRSNEQRERPTRGALAAAERIGGGGGSWRVVGEGEEGEAAGEVASPRRGWTSVRVAVIADVVRLRARGRIDFPEWRFFRAVTGTQARVLEELVECLVIKRHREDTVREKDSKCCRNSLVPC